MGQTDQVFWDRLSGMPPTEAEEECVLRRIELSERVGHLRRQVASAKARGDDAAATKLGQEVRAVDATLTRVNERIKQIRKLLDRIQWRETVRELFGEEAVEACLIHMEIRYGELFDKRREWAVAQ